MTTNRFESVKLMAPDYVAATPVGTVFTEGFHFFKTGLSKNYNPQTGGQSIYNKYYRMAQTYQGATYQLQLNGTFMNFEYAEIFEKYVPLTWNNKTAKMAMIQRATYKSYTSPKTGTISAAPSDNKTFTLGSAQSWAANDVLKITSGPFKGFWVIAVAAGVSSTSFVVSEKIGNLSSFNNASYEIYDGNSTYTEIDGTSGNFKARTYKGMIAQWALMDGSTVGETPIEKKTFTAAITVGAVVSILT